MEHPVWTSEFSDEVELEDGSTCTFCPCCEQPEDSHSDDCWTLRVKPVEVDSDYTRRFHFDDGLEEVPGFLR